MKLKLLAAAAALCGTMPASAAIVAESLPYEGTPDWTDIVFGGTSMTTDGTKSVLTTNQGRGVWFGWGAWYGNQPAWTPGSASAGNHLALDLSFSTDAADWSAYFYDMSHEAAFQFNPTGCADACYDDPHLTGVNLLFGQVGSPNIAVTQFVGLDTSARHSYEFLLRDGLVSYRIDGAVYSGLAYQAGLGAPLLVIGDGSGSTQTGVGSMTVHGLSIDTAPEERVLTGAVPEPSSWAMMLAGVGLTGAFLRRRAAKAVLAAAV